MSPFEVIEHTADVGLRIWAADLELLFAEAARGLLSLVVENPPAVEPRQKMALDLEAEDLTGLFIDWLRELIYRFEVDHLLISTVVVSISADHRRLHADCAGEPADWSRHLCDNELKAVTYQQLRVEQTRGGWEAEVIFDI